MKTSYALLIIVMICSISCADHSKDVPDRNFYYEVRTLNDNKLCNELASLMVDRIPQRKYAITNQSGLVWPYYKELELDESISIDSLMPPHWYLHKMTLRNENTVVSKDDHIVRIDLMPQPDTILNYRVDIYEMDSIGLTLTGTSGIHFVDSTEFSSRSLLLDHCLKSIIRYSFK